MTAYLDTLASYVPSLIIRRANEGAWQIDEPTVEVFPAVVLFADVSGFTALTERLAARGPSGAEDLTRYLNTYFGELIEVINAAGGDTVKFAGDALLALWPAEDEAELVSLAETVAEAALQIQARLHDHEVGDGIRLSLKLAIGAGEVAAEHLGGVFNRWELLIAGGPLSQVGVANGQASPGQVVAAREAWALLRDSGTATPLNEGVMLLSALTRRTRAVITPRPAPDPTASDALRRFIPGAIRARLDAGQSDWLAELRPVTVVFINLPDFTYDTPLDKAQEAMKTLQTALYRFEGSINKISVDDKGASLIAVLGLPPLAHEDDPERGLRAAQMMQQGLTRLGQKSSVGVTTGGAFCGAVGSALRREYTVMGDVVNLAARLMVAAQGGILCDEPTAKAAGARVTCEALPPIKVKGKEAPIAIFRPGAARADREAPRKRKSRIVGREAERAQVATILNKDALGQAVLVQGDVGMGKTRLLQDMIVQAEERGFAVLSGAGDSIDSNTPYHAWRPVLEQVFSLGQSADGEAGPAAILARLPADEAIIQRAPLLGTILAMDWPDSETTKKLAGRPRADALQGLVGEILQRMAVRLPLLLVIKDAQWLDSASWSLLGHVRKAVPSLTVALGARLAADIAHEEIDGFIAATGASRIVLGPLARPEVRTILCDQLSVDSVPDSVLDLVVERTDGNPFFSEELICALRDGNFLEIRDRIAHVAPNVGEPRSWKIPSTVQGVVTGRIDRLPPPEQLTLKVASVVGRVFARGTVRDIYPMQTAGDVLEGHFNQLNGLELAPVIKQQTFLRAREADVSHKFKNSLIQDTAYNLMLFSQRRLLHRAVAEWYEGHHGDDLTAWLPVLAYHWRKAAEDPVPDRAALLKAIDYYEQAGNRAAAAFVNDEAIHFFQEAIALLGQLPAEEELQRRELHLQLALGTAAVAAKSYAAPEVQVAYGRARDLCARVGDHAQMFRAMRGMWQYHSGQGDTAEAKRIGQDLIELATLSGESALLLEANRMLGNNAYWTGNFGEARHFMEEAVALYCPEEHAGLVAQFSQDPDVANRGILAWALCFLGYPDTALSHIDQATTRADAMEHPFTRVFAYGAAMWAHKFLWETAGTERWADATIALAAERGFPYLGVAGKIVRGWARLRRGEADGLTEVEETVRAWRGSGATIGLSLFLVVLAESYLYSGRIDDAEAALNDPVLSQRSVSERWLEAEAHRLRGEVALARHDFAVADQAFRMAWHIADSQDNRLVKLRIAMALTRMAGQHKSASDGPDLLRAAYNALDEGAQVGVVMEAKRAIEAWEQSQAARP